MKTALIGVGNILYKDEGVGVYSLKYLEENYSFLGDVTLVDGGTLGFKLVEYCLDFDRVIILDTVSIKERPGTVYSLPAHEVTGLGEYRSTVHEIEIAQAIEMSMLYDKRADITIVGIIPEDILSVDIALSDTIKDNFGFFIDAVLKELEKSGITHSLQNESKTIDEIIEAYADPSKNTPHG